MSELTNILTPSEAELYIESLNVLKLPEIGSRKWWSGHDYLEKLNMQAVINVSTNTDEFVKEFLISHDKVSVLIVELITTEVWKERVYPMIAERASELTSTLPVYMVLFHEATVAGLLETTLYHREACEQAGDVILDLVDFCQRKICRLLARLENEANNLSAVQVREGSEANRSNSEELRRQESDIDFNVAMKCLSLVRYLCDSVECVPLSVSTRLLNTHDFPCLLVQLLEHAPWQRKSSSGGIEKFDDGNWRAVAVDAERQLCKVEGQVWLSIYQLLLHPDMQRKYDFTDYRKTQALKLRRYLNEPLLDQLPHLSVLQRFLENLSVMEPAASRGAELILEQLPQARDSIEREYNGRWQSIAQKQLQLFTLDESGMKEHANRLLETYNLDILEKFADLPAAAADPVCANCGLDAVNRCSSCQQEWYCSRPCQVKHWKIHKSTCSKNNNTTKSTDQSNELVTHVS